MTESHVIGVDFGTLSGGPSWSGCPTGPSSAAPCTSTPTPWSRSSCPDRRAAAARLGLQVPSDYVEVLQTAVPKALAASGVAPSDVIGIATDFTACTVLPPLADGTPLCELPELRRPSARLREAVEAPCRAAQADRINALAARARRAVDRALRRPASPRSGSSPRGCSCSRRIPSSTPHGPLGRGRGLDRLAAVRHATSATRAPPATRASTRTARTRRADFLAALDPRLRRLRRRQARRSRSRRSASAPARLTAEAAGWTGLPAGIAVAVGNVDAHVTAPAAQAVEPGQMLAVMGTSTCHVMNGDVLREVPGMCGVVDGRDRARPVGLRGRPERRRRHLRLVRRARRPAEYRERRGRARPDACTSYLTELAARQPVGEHGLVALDWHSGNRSVLVDHELSGLVVGLTLATRPEDIYRALLEATAFGTRTIIEAFERPGVPVTELVVAGGLLKNRFLMQIYADVTRRPLSARRSAQGPALGSAIHAAVAAGAYPDIHAAAAAMGTSSRRRLRPTRRRAEAYDALYAEYARAARLLRPRRVANEAHAPPARIKRTASVR